MHTSLSRIRPLSDVPEHLRMYFDYEAWARDWFSSGLVLVDGYVFSY